MTEDISRSGKTMMETLRGARYAFLLLGVMTLLVFLAAFFALSERAEAPTGEGETTAP